MAPDAIRVVRVSEGQEVSSDWIWSERFGGVYTGILDGCSVKSFDVTLWYYVLDVCKQCMTGAHTRVTRHFFRSIVCSEGRLCQVLFAIIDPGHVNWTLCGICIIKLIVQ